MLLLLCFEVPFMLGLTGYSLGRTTVGLGFFVIIAQILFHVICGGWCPLRAFRVGLACVFIRMKNLSTQRPKAFKELFCQMFSSRA